MAFAHSQNPFFVNCSFSEHVGNINSFHNTWTLAGPLQILWGAIASGAAYNSEERYPHPRCLPRTRVDSIQNIKDWANSGKSSILWLHGPAGAGKSAVAQTISETWAEAELLLASFFFSRTASTRNTVDRFIPTLAYQSVQTLAGHLDPILSVIEKNPQILRLDIRLQIEKLLIGPIQDIMKENQNQKHPRFIVIDAVDECTGSENQLRLLSTLLSLIDPKYGLPIRLLIVSRPEAHIRHAFDNLLNPVSTIESLQGAIEDVYKYLQFKFNEIHDSGKHMDVMQYVSKPWPGKEVLRELTRRSGGYFIYAATVVRHVDEEGYVCTDRLNDVLNRSPGVLGSYPYRELDKIYAQIMSTNRNIQCLKRILGCIIVGRRTLVSYDPIAVNVPTSAIINALFSFRPGELKMILRGLYSIIFFPESDTDDIRFYHASFSDYLIDKERSQTYYIDYEATVQDIDWVVATSVWTKLGRTADVLITHLHAENGLAVELLRPLIEQSREWTEELQFSIICLLCAMIFLLKDHPRCKKTIDKLSTLCQLAFVLHISSSTSMSGLVCIQDVRTLLETYPLNERSWQFQKLTVKGVLKLSPFEKTCVDRFLLYISHTRNRSFQETRLIIVTNMESATWVDSCQILEQMLEQFLDNEKIWGGICEKKERITHLQKGLVDSSRWFELSHGHRVAQLQRSDHDSWLPNVRTMESFPPSFNPHNKARWAMFKSECKEELLSNTEDKRLSKLILQSKRELIEFDRRRQEQLRKQTFDARGMKLVLLPSLDPAYTAIPITAGIQRNRLPLFTTEWTSGSHQTS